MRQNTTFVISHLICIMITSKFEFKIFKIQNRNLGVQKMRAYMHFHYKIQNTLRQTKMRNQL
jgi:hypothetical protein